MSRHGTDKEVYVTGRENVKSLWIRRRSRPLDSNENTPVAMVIPPAPMMGLTTMAIIAQLSDLHVSDPTPSRSRPCAGPWSACSRCPRAPTASS